MSDVAIRVRNLSKQYRIGGPRVPYKTIREAFIGTAQAPFRRARKLLSGQAYGAAELDETIWALKDVSFDVKHGEVIGVIGRNGAGKSTLLKILSRITEPTEGEAEIHGRVGSLLEVGTGFHPELTGRENIYLNGAILGMKRAEIERKFDEIVDFAEIEKFLDTPVKHYSSGMYVRLAFAVAAHLEPEILLVDEVLAVGDAAFQKKCLGKMGDVARGGRTVLFVSHNMAAILNLCGSGVVFEEGRLGFSGDVKDAVRHYNLASDTLSNKSKDWAPHVIYETLGDSGKADFAITKIEVIDSSGEPKPLVSTWEDFTLRIWYYSRKYIQNGSVILQLRTYDGLLLLTLSTQPDWVMPLEVEPGEHFVDCVIQSLPLAAGEYLIGVGLAVPKIEMLWWRPELCRLIVGSRDVYGSGIAPAAPRSLVAIQHQWRSSS